MDGDVGSRVIGETAQRTCWGAMGSHENGVVGGGDVEIVPGKISVWGRYVCCSAAVHLGKIVKLERRGI